MEDGRPRYRSRRKSDRKTFGCQILMSVSQFLFGNAKMKRESISRENPLRLFILIEAFPSDRVSLFLLTCPIYSGQLLYPI